MTRFFDLLVVVTLAPLLFLFFLAIVLIYLAIGEKNIFYSEVRIGLHGRHFTMYKFRTMATWSDQDIADYLNNRPPSELTYFKEMRRLVNDPRVSQFFRILRWTKLDELPQFLNILRGEMAVVGIRPVTELELENYMAFKIPYQNFTPGLTGLFQCFNSENLQDQLTLDAIYIYYHSLLLDILIFFATPIFVFLQLVGGTQKLQRFICKHFGSKATARL